MLLVTLCHHLVSLVTKGLISLHAIISPPVDSVIPLKTVSSLIFTSLTTIVLAHNSMPLNALFQIVQDAVETLRTDKLS